MGDEIVHSFSKEKRWTNDENTGAKFPLCTSVIKHWEHLRSIILFSKVVSDHEDDIHVIWLQLRRNITAEDDEALQFACGVSECIDMPEPGRDQMPLRRPVTKARYHLGK